MIPRSLCGSVWGMAGRTRRPKIEAMLVREAVLGRGGSAEAKARALAKEVVAELIAYLDEEGDELMQALGELRRAAFSSPAVKLATDPEVDTLSLFIEGRISRLRARGGRGLCDQADATDRNAVLAKLERQLAGRYLRHQRQIFPSSVL